MPVMTVSSGESADAHHGAGGKQRQRAQPADTYGPIAHCNYSGAKLTGTGFLYVHVPPLATFLTAVRIASMH